MRLVAFLLDSVALKLYNDRSVSHSCVTFPNYLTRNMPMVRAEIQNYNLES